MNIQDIVNLQAQKTAQWHEIDPAISQDGFLGLVEGNHQQNFLLWHEEDIARCDDIGAERVVLAKRNIDRFNQKRNDLVEQMDKHLVQQLKPRESGCSFNSETPGMMVDRLSILALKQYHMAEEVARTDAASEHIEKCSKKLAVIKQQIEDLSCALTELLDQVADGTRSFRVYFQFKMYNDTETNPQLRRAA